MRDLEIINWISSTNRRILRVNWMRVPIRIRVGPVATPVLRVPRWTHGIIRRHQLHDVWQKREEHHGEPLHGIQEVIFVVLTVTKHGAAAWFQVFTAN